MKKLLKYPDALHEAMLRVAQERDIPVTSLIRNAMYREIREDVGRDEVMSMKGVIGVDEVGYVLVKHNYPKLKKHIEDLGYIVKKVYKK
jgi:hypothetical protein